MRSFTTNALWGARCGESARRVLTGGTSTRGHAGSVRSPARKRRLRQGSAKATASRLVSTDRRVDWAPLRVTKHSGEQTAYRERYSRIYPRVYVGLRTDDPPLSHEHVKQCLEFRVQTIVTFYAENSLEQVVCLWRRTSAHQDTLNVSR